MPPVDDDCNPARKLPDLHPKFIIYKVLCLKNTNSSNETADGELLQRLLHNSGYPPWSENGNFITERTYGERLIARALRSYFCLLSAYIGAALSGHAYCLPDTENIPCKRPYGKR